MIRTYNRTPLNFGKASQNADNIKHFNTFDFKGLIDNKNFLTVDQNSFSDCSNVYVDSEGLLRSRPSLKEDKIIVKLDTGDVVLSNIINVKSFSDVIVYQSENNGKYYLTFINEDFEKNVQVECEENIKLVLADKKIFVFAENSLNYYNTDTNAYFTGEDYIYKPVTKYFVDNIETQDVVKESPNILTNSDIYKYIYTNVLNGDYSTLIGKKVSVQINDKDYTFTFTENKNYTFVDKHSVSTKTSNLVSDKTDNHIPCVLGIGGELSLMVDISDNTDVYLATEYIIEDTDTNYLKRCKYSYFYSVNGLIYNKLPSLEGAITDAKVSKNGAYAVTMRKDGPYIISILDTQGSTTGIYKYPTWTNLLKYHGDDTEYDFDSGSTVDEYGYAMVNLENSTVLNLDIFDDDNFTILYGKTPIDSLPPYTNLFYANTKDHLFYKTYTELECLYCINKVIKTKTISKLNPQIVELKYVDASIDLLGPSTKAQYRLEFTNIVPGSEVGDNIAHMEFNWALKTFSGEVVESGTVSKDFENQTPTRAASYVQYYDQYVGNKDTGTSSILFRAMVTYTNTRNIVCNIIPGYYIYKDGNDYKFAHGLTYDSEENGEHNLVLVGHKPQIKLDKIEDEQFGIIGNYYGIQIYGNNFDNVSMRSNRAYFEIFNDNFSVSSLSDENKNLILYSKTTLDGPYVKSTLLRSPLSDGLSVKVRSYKGEYYCAFNKLSYLYSYGTTFNYLVSHVVKESLEKTYTTYSGFLGYSTSTLDYPFGYDESTRFVFSNDANYVLTNNKLYKLKYGFNYDEPGDFDLGKLEEIDLIVEGYPLKISELNNYLQNIIYYDIDKDSNIATIYKTVDKIEISLENEKDNKYFLPDYIAELENFYFANKEELYISVKRVNNENRFMWYFPETQRHIYNYNITNLHPISTSEMAVFFKDEIRYITYDTESSAHRDYKTRLDIGCRPGSDVITTYDSKYTIFTTDRGMVAMSYQEFISSTEQALSYLSDNIYEVFNNYIKDAEVKLHKFGFWIIVYRLDRSNGFLFDLRTSTWWPIDCTNNIQKLFNYNSNLYLLSDNKILKPDKTDLNYYDYIDGVSKNISWYIKSQKLYLGAPNYNKLVFNMTFSSVHNLEELENANIPITDTTFKLQIRNYRKNITGSIGTESSTVINYNVNSARTYVQRMNYGNINEFEYLLSFDDTIENQIPLSLNSISVKYKIGGPVR